MARTLVMTALVVAMGLAPGPDWLPVAQPAAAQDTRYELERRRSVDRDALRGGRQDLERRSLRRELDARDRDRRFRRNTERLRLERQIRTRSNRTTPTLPR